MATLLTSVVIGQFGCGTSTETPTATPSQTPPQQVPVFLPQSVAEAERRALYREYADIQERISGGGLESTRQEQTQRSTDLEELTLQLRSLEARIIAPSQEDLDRFPDFVNAEKQGIFRLLARGGKCDRKHDFLSVSGNACYYTFHNKNHAYGFGSDLSYQTFEGSPEGIFTVGFAGVDYGFFGCLGDIDLTEVSEADPLVRGALAHRPPDGLSEPSWRAEQRRFTDAGLSARREEGGPTRTPDEEHFADRVESHLGFSYVVRSVNEGRHDTVAIFQAVRADSLDDSLIIIYKILRESPIASVRRERPQGRGFDSFAGFDGRDGG